MDLADDPYQIALYLTKDHPRACCDDWFRCLSFGWPLDVRVYRFSQKKESP